MGVKKIKPVKKLQKKPVLPPDTAFERVKKWAEKNYTLAIGVGGATLLAVILAWGFISHDRSKQEHAQSAYGLLVQRFPEDGKTSPADWESLVPGLQKFISEYGNTAPALDARMELAKAYFETKRYADAVKAGEEALGLAPQGSNLRPLIMYQLGYAYEAAGKSDEAFRMWTGLKQLGMIAFEREADWNLAKILESKKELDKAVEMYQAASQSPGEFPPSALIEQQIARVKAEQR